MALIAIRNFFHVSSSKLFGNLGAPSKSLQAVVDIRDIYRLDTHDFRNIPFVIVENVTNVIVIGYIIEWKVKKIKTNKFTLVKLSF